MECLKFKQMKESGRSTDEVPLSAAVIIKVIYINLGTLNKSSECLCLRTNCGFGVYKYPRFQIVFVPVLWLNPIWFKLYLRAYSKLL